VAASGDDHDLYAWLVANKIGDAVALAALAAFLRVRREAQPAKVLTGDLIR